MEEGNDKDVALSDYGKAKGVKAADVPSNERLLCTAFVSFMGFAVAQTIAAIFAGSEAMLGDSAAMMVDDLTYLFNWYAERQKQSYADKLRENASGRTKLEYRKYTYQLELIPPLLSVGTLLVVTAFVINKAVRVLILDAKRDISEQAKPNIELMILFSFLNLLLDSLNVFCFARAKHALGYHTHIDEEADESEDVMEVRTLQSLLDNDVHKHHGVAPCDCTRDGIQSSANGRMEPLEIASGEPSSPHEGSNLNMCSAYTHVFADTLRSLAAIIASVLAEVIPVVTAEEADATAAVVVSGLIVLSLVPLVGGMVQTQRSLKRVNILLLEEELDVFDDCDDG